MRILFEIDNLNEASPAIISRAGVIYFSDKDIQSSYIWKRWLNQLPPHITVFSNKWIFEQLKFLFENIYDKIFFVFSRKC